MKEYKAYFRTVINLISLKQTIRRKMKLISEGPYISIRAKFMLDGNNHPTHSLGKRFYLDMTKESDKHFYISYLIERYNSDFVNRDETSKITGLYLEVLKSSKENYTNFIYNLNQEKEFDQGITQGIKSKENLPLNTLYKSWVKFNIYLKIFIPLQIVILILT